MDHNPTPLALMWALANAAESRALSTPEGRSDDQTFQRGILLGLSLSLREVFFTRTMEDREQFVYEHAEAMRETARQSLDALLMSSIEVVKTPRARRRTRRG